MKKLLLTLTLLLTAATMMASEHSVTISRSEGEFSESSGVYYGIKDGVMMTFTSGLDNENFLVEHQQTNFEVRSSHYIIKKIVFHCLDDATSDNMDVFYWGPTTISIVQNFTYPNAPGTYVADGYTGTWTGETKAIQFSTMAKPVRFASIDIIYDKLDGDIFDLVTNTNQIVEGKTYIIVSQYYDKVMKFKKTDDATFPSTNIVEWMNAEKTKVKVDGNACLFTMEGVKDTLSTPQKAAWLNTLNGYIRSQNYNLITLTNPNAYCRAHMYISANESNLLLKFNDLSSGGNTYTVRYDYEAGNFKMLNYNDDTQQRVWLYKLAESYHVYTECVPEQGGAITLGDGVVEGTSQQYETVRFTVTPTDGWQLDKLSATDSQGNIVPVTMTEDGYTLTMPDDDVTIRAEFSEIPEEPTYPITTECVPEQGGIITLTGGTLPVQGAIVSTQGTTVTFTIAAADGYTFEGYEATSANADGTVNLVTVIPVTDDNGNVLYYSFTMPAAPVHIVAKFKAGGTSAISETRGQASVTAIEYINVAGVKSAQPHDGINIVVTRYNDGTRTVTKTVK